MSNLDALQPLIGTWEMTGQTLGDEPIQVRGTTTIAWAVEGAVLTSTGEMQAGDFRVGSLEVVWQEPDRDDLPAHVYGGGAAPLEYRWDVDVDGTFVHAGGGATYRGTLSADGRTLTGGWRPDPGAEVQPGSAYDVVMRKID